jgi:hypothetical protein
MICLVIALIIGLGGKMGFSEDKEYEWRDIHGNLQKGIMSDHSRINMNELENMGIVKPVEDKYNVDNIPFGGALGNLYRRMDSDNFFHGV